MKKTKHLLLALCIGLTAHTSIADSILEEFSSFFHNKQHTPSHANDTHGKTNIKSAENHTRTYLRTTMNWVVAVNSQPGFSKHNESHRPYWSIAIGRQRPNNMFIELEYTQIGFNLKSPKPADAFCREKYFGDILFFNLGKEWQIQKSKNYFFMGGGIGPSLNRLEDPVIVPPTGSTRPCGVGKSVISPAGQLFFGVHHKFNENVYVGLTARYMVLGRFKMDSICCTKTPCTTGIGSLGFEIKTYL